MKPKIDGTEFGSITIEGETFDHDVLIRPDGTVKKRKKQLSKAIYGTSHTVSLDEAEHIFKDKAEQLIVGTGQEGMVQLSDEASAFFKQHHCKATLLPTPEAIDYWNQAKGKAIGLFHVTC
ncbi:MAG: Mth938-like domain-containing protein [Betaproteobacteria bacterium]|nr:Mth938-like domain-containing protein [Betaproteobacteria bacterium]